MRNILAIAQNTFRETIRDRILYVIFVFAALMIVGSLLAASISLGQDAKVIKDFGLASIFIFSILMTVFIGTNLVYKEIDKRTIFMLLSKPIERREVILGKFFGLGGTMGVMLVLLSVFFMGLVRYKTGAWDWILIEAIIFNYFEILFAIGLTITFSTFAAPIASAIYTLLIFVIGHSTSTMMAIAKSSDGMAKWALEAAYYIFPNLEKFNLRNGVVYGIGIQGEQLFWVVMYALVYITLLLIISINILKRQEF